LAFTFGIVLSFTFWRRYGNLRRVILLEKVEKRFGSRWAVRSLDFEVPQGGIFGLLGHNGAGKSTIIGMMLGQVFPSAGQVSINGFDVFKERREALARVGAIFETPAFYPYLSGWTNLRMFCQFTAECDRARMEEVARFVNLQDCIRDRVGTYSHGMRKRLALAQALLPVPSLLILDEPMEGLDPEGVHEMRNLILKLNREWKLTILFSSHVLSEVQQLCSDVALLKQGSLIFAGNWREAGGGDSLEEFYLKRVREPGGAE
jgi:ABC-2 type transport system ATP-binding protein